MQLLEEGKAALVPVLLGSNLNEVTRKTPLFEPFIYLEYIYIKKRSFYQDRLGTNIGKALKIRPYPSGQHLHYEPTT
eukprot:COSAG06_NODE_1816_length_8301_cov_28.278225_7_plen_77_part_00